MSPAPPLALLLALSGCEAEKAPPPNTPPEVTITAPTGEIPEGEPYRLAADLSDAETAAERLGAYWSLGDGTPLLGERRDADGCVTLDVTEGLIGGVYLVEVRVVDPAGAAAVDAMEFTVQSNGPPLLAFVEPAEGGWARETEAVRVDLSVTGGAGDVALVWSGAGTDAAPAAPGADGHAVFDAEGLVAGTQAIAVTATDGVGHVSALAVSFEVIVPDEDGDGYDDVAWEGDDCDDADAGAYPGAPEICEDGRDQDCDGRDGTCALEGDLSLASADAKLYGSGEGLLTGQSVAGGGDLDGDGYDDVLVGSWFSPRETSALNYVWVVYPPVAGSVPLGAAFARLNGDSIADGFGAALSLGPDVTGDGAADWAVGAPGGDLGMEDGGAIYVFDAAPSTTTYTASVIAAAIFTGTVAADAAGSALALTGDMGGDAAGELAIGASAAEGGAGAVYLFAGPIGRTAGRDVATADARIDGEDPEDAFGTAIADLGDFDGDGLSDLLVGAPFEDDGGFNAGAVYVFTSMPTGTVSASAWDLKLVGEVSNDGLGGCVAAGGDVDADGRADLLVSREVGGISADVTYVVSGGIVGRHVVEDVQVGKLLGEDAADHAGGALDGAGDVDGDGRADVLIGAYQNGTAGVGAGAAYLVYGPVTGAWSLGSAGARFRGDDAFDLAGFAVAGAGDTNGDGLDDVLIGAYGDDEGGGGAGATYLSLGAAR